MFRLLKAGLPADTVFSDDLNELGYFIDKEGVVRKIRPPHGTFQYWICNNERINDTHREAVHQCIMTEVHERLAALGFPRLWLPQLTATKPKNEPSLPILLPKQEELKQKMRVVVVINDDYQDPGSMAFRLLTKEAGLETGSMVCLAKEMHTGNSEQKEVAPEEIREPGLKHRRMLAEKAIKEQEELERQYKAAQEKGPDTATNGAGGESKESDKAAEISPLDDKPMDTTNATFEVPTGFKTPGLVWLNTGQLIYSHREDRAMTNLSWDTKPRMSGASPRTPIDPHFNKIEGNGSIDEHVKFVFDKVISSKDWVSEDAELYLIGAGNGGDALLRFLDSEWPKYKSRVAAIALAGPTPVQPADPIKDPDLVEFLRCRCRAMEPSAEPFLTALAVPTPFKQSAEADGSQHKTDEGAIQNDKGSIWIQDVAQGDKEASSISAVPGKIVSAFKRLVVNETSDSENPEPAQSEDWGVHYFPRLSSGVPTFAECILASTYKYILSWFEEVAADPKSYRNQDFTVPTQPVAGAEVENAEVFDASVEPKENVQATMRELEGDQADDEDATAEATAAQTIAAEEAAPDTPTVAASEGQAE